MKTLLMAAAVAAMALPPSLASAQQWRAAPHYGAYDPCAGAKRAAGNRGALTGGVLGAVAGSAIAGRGSRAGGAVVGGAIGALAGHEIGRSNVSCSAYPRGRRAHANCRWVNDRGHGLEICRNRDGYWRPR